MIFGYQVSYGWFFGGPRVVKRMAKAVSGPSLFRDRKFCSFYEFIFGDSSGSVFEDLVRGFEGREIGAVAEHEGEELASVPVAGDVTFGFRQRAEEPA